MIKNKTKTVLRLSMDNNQDLFGKVSKHETTVSFHVNIDCYFNHSSYIGPGVLKSVSHLS